MKDLDIDLPNAKLAYTIIQSLLEGHESLSDLLVVMSHALDEDTLKALTATSEWQSYLESKRNLIIIGAGPAGITAAYQAKKHNLNYLVIEKGLIGNTVYQYPVGLTVFSTTNELEIEPGGLNPAREKPTREELLSYYVRFVLDNELNVQTEETVLSVHSAGSAWSAHPVPSVLSVSSVVNNDGIIEQTESAEGLGVHTDGNTEHTERSERTKGAERTERAE